MQKNSYFLKMQKVFNEYSEILAVYLFGSFAKNKTTKDSDVDMGILLKDNVSSERKLDIRLNLMAEIESIFNRKCEVIILQDAPLLLLYQIFRCRNIIYEKKHLARINFESLKRREYFDFKFYQERHSQIFRKRLVKGGLLGCYRGS
ncbi:MAG: hypothetical protein DDT21_02659 [Syntrophomonadaceae bacterium]|nr:hypothetical protein [Bacillota bacterium]